MVRVDVLRDKGRGLNSKASPKGAARPKRTGGGPKLSRNEWVALIAVHRAYGADPVALSAALVRASDRLIVIAADAGSARGDTRLRSQQGLRRRMTVIRALEAGDTGGQPVEAKSAWALFAERPEEARRLADEVLGLADRSVIEHKVSDGGGFPSPLWSLAEPSRGPAPAPGSAAFVREDGDNHVYVMRLVGPLAPSLYDGDCSIAVVKIGRSADPARRRVELGAGLPPGCGLEWRLVHELVLPSAAAAHDFEQALLARLYRLGLTIGGEFARLPERDVAGLLEDVTRD